MNNKELIDKLQDYLLAQDPKIVSRLLANCMVDFNRIYSLENLPAGEVDCLFERIEKNALTLREFAKKDIHEPLSIGPLK